MSIEVPGDNTVQNTISKESSKINWNNLQIKYSTTVEHYGIKVMRLVGAETRKRQRGCNQGPIIQADLITRPLSTGLRVTGA